MTVAPVRKSVTVKAPVNRAFHVFTSEINSWWPSTHHIGKTPMTRNVLEDRLGGRCYSEHADGSEVDWGRIVAWEPPSRFVMAWQVTPDWKYEPDLSKCSEVEVSFTALPDGMTRVEVEHRHFERHGAIAQTVRDTFDGPGAWSGMLDLFRAKAEEN